MFYPPHDVFQVACTRVSICSAPAQLYDRATYSLPACMDLSLLWQYGSAGGIPGCVLVLNERAVPKVPAVLRALRCCRLTVCSEAGAACIGSCCRRGAADHEQSQRGSHCEASSSHYAAPPGPRVTSAVKSFKIQGALYFYDGARQAMQQRVRLLPHWPAHELHCRTCLDRLVVVLLLKPAA
jgi:hypothetical protein